MPATLAPGRTWIAVLMLAVCVGLPVLLHVYPPPSGGLWTQTFFNSLHVPVFGAVALALYIATGAFVRLGFRQRIVVALVMALLLGVVSEAAQIPVARDASIEDLFSDWAGSLGVLLMVFAALGHGRAGRPTRMLAGIASVLLLSVALWPLIHVSAAYGERYRTFPVIFSFDATFHDTFLREQDAVVDKTWNSSANRIIGNVILGHGRYPGLIFHDIWPDWRDYASVVFELRLDDDVPLDINIRVHDRIHRLGDQPHSDRFNARYTLQPGPQAIRIPLNRIREAPRNRRMDLAHIDGIVIFASRNDVGRSFELAEIRLE